MKIAMRLLDAAHFRCLNARGTLFTVQNALRLFNVFVGFTNPFEWYRCRWVRAWGSRPSRSEPPKPNYGTDPPEDETYPPRAVLTAGREVNPPFGHP
jgi:hypothetical protein